MNRILEDGILSSTRGRVIATSLAMLVLGLILVIVGLVTTGLLAQFVGVVATTVLTIGIVTLLTEFLLKQGLASDILNFLQTDRALLDAGLHRFRPVRADGWIDTVGDSPYVNVGTMNPDGFFDHIWPSLVEIAKKRALVVELAVLDPTYRQVSEIGRRYAIGGYAREVIRVRALIENDWRENRPNLASGSALTIRYLTAPIEYGYLATSSDHCLLLPPIKAQIGQNDSFAVIFATHHGDDRRAAWLVESVEYIRAKVLTSSVFSDEDEPGEGEG